MRLLVYIAPAEALWSATAMAKSGLPLGLIPQGLLHPITRAAALLTTVAMAALGLGVDVRIVARTGARVTLAVTASLIVLGIMSYGLIRLTGMP